MAGGDQFWYMENRADYGSVIMGDLQDYKENIDISGDCLNDIRNEIEDDVFEYSVKTAEYEDTTKLYDIINHYMDDEILTVVISHPPDQHPLVTITNTEHDPCLDKYVQEDQTDDSSINEDRVNIKSEDGFCVDVEEESLEETPKILLTGHPGDILGQIFDDQLGVLYNIYRYQISINYKNIEKYFCHRADEQMPEGPVPVEAQVLGKAGLSWYSPYILWRMVWMVVFILGQY